MKDKKDLKDIKKNKKDGSKTKLKSAQLIPLSFLGVILIGTLLLMLPAAKAGEAP